MASSSPSSLFPLRTIEDVRRLFKAQLERDECEDGDVGGPDLALLSVVAGSLEDQWTTAQVGRVAAGAAAAAKDSRGPIAETSSSSTTVSNPCQHRVDPPLEWSTVEAMVEKFDAIVRGYCDSDTLDRAKSTGSEDDVRRLIKHVADIVWNTLSKSHYKDRPHLQSLFSYLTGNKLDCFGVAFAVVAACQRLRVPQVHLALSEDHAWVVFGRDGTCTAEVTWHGKGNEDKRGRPVDIERARSSWLYLAGQPVVCDRRAEVAAIVSSVNPSITASVDSIECGAMQQELLWLLYDMGHLSSYPMALGNLGDLEEICSSLGRPPCTKIFEEAVEVSRRVYSNHHVYPYTYQAGFFYRDRQLKRALQSWAGAADAIKGYRYSKDDEEIYKEFMEIANELIPHLVKTAALNPKDYSEVLGDPECFAAILKFYDGICCWEEGSATPVLHVTWAKHMVSTCLKFDADVRARVDIPASGAAAAAEESDKKKEEKVSGGEEELEDEDAEKVPEEKEEEEEVINNNYCRKRSKKYKSSGGGSNCDSKSRSVRAGEQNQVQDDNGDDTNENICDKEKSLVLERLSEGCGDRILNMEYLVGKSGKKGTIPPSFVPSNSLEEAEELLKYSKGGMGKRKRGSVKKSAKSVSVVSGAVPDAAKTTVAVLRLHSAKMRGLKDLLRADKLNTSAIQLQLTAQSEGGLAGDAGEAGSGSAGGGRSKRSRRE